MKKQFITFVIISLLFNFIYAKENKSADSQKKAYLYGENHGEQHLIEIEVNAWQDYYTNQNMRHLFIENSYPAVQLLNEWMKADNDDILLQLYDDWEGTACHCEPTLYFFRTIKETCPETIFHGTDIGHQYASNGSYYLKKLQEMGMENSEQYNLTLENNRQAIDFYNTDDWSVRENYMVQNFIREYDSLPPGTKIMGIYGSAHLFLKKDMSNKVPSMINQLKKHYKKDGVIWNLTDISNIKLDPDDVEPLEIKNIGIAGKMYEAKYYGEEDMTGYMDYVSIEYWLLENAFDDFKDCKKNKYYMPQSSYPFALRYGDVYRIMLKKADGSIEIQYYIVNGKKKEGIIASFGIKVKE